MAYTPHTLVSFGGKLTNNASPDQWQCGVRLAILQNDGISWSAGLTAPAVYLASLYGALQTWFQRAKVSTAGSEFATLRADAYLDWVKVNNLDALGHYSPPGVTNRHDYSGTVGGGGSVNVILPFVTAAVSLTTALQRGPGHRGRIYLPFSIATTSTGYLAAGDQAGCNGTVKALLTVLKNAGYTDAGGTVVPIVASKINGAKVPITGVATGSVFDVQRRRKEQLPETYVSSVWP